MRRQFLDPPGRAPGPRLLVALAIAAGLAPAPVLALDLLNPFGLFGPAEQPPAPTREGIAYAVTFEGIDDSGLLQRLQDASTLHRLRQEPPPDGAGLVRRAEADLLRLVDVLWGEGYYDGRIAVRIGDVVVEPGSARAAAAARRAETDRGRAVVPVALVATPGPLYTLRTASIRRAGTGQPFTGAELPPRIVGLEPGGPASTAAVLAAQARIVDHFRAAGHPFAKVARTDPVIDHRARALDVTLLVEPGPVAAIGPVTVRGTQALDPAVVRSFIYTEPGDPYSPQALAGIRKSAGRVEGLGSVRVREAEALDADGRLPIVVDVTERPPNLAGVSARYSTVDGPGVKGYWADRNLFGGGETLRLDADLFYLDHGGDERVRRLAGLDDSGIGGRLGATFVKPALWGSRNDLLVGASVAREATQGYVSTAGGATIAVRHRFSDTFSVQGGIEAQGGTARDVLGSVDYTLIGVPVSVAYDTTDSPLDPTRGVRLSASAAAYPAFLGSDPGLVIAKAQGSTYYSLDEAGRYVLAGRLGFGSIAGAELEQIPANLRFFAGGGGSVRGFAYRTLGPVGPFNLPIGGRSLLEGSVEARIKVTDTIGVVPFLDAGTAFRSSLPDFEERVRFAAGLGLRYYTAIGPIRLDVAVPLDHEKGRQERPVALYLSLGQAF